MFMGSQGGVMGMVRGQVTGQGLFTTTLKGHGSVAVMAHGGVIELPITPRPSGPRRPAGVRRPPRRRPQQALHRARLARHGGPRLGRGVPAGADRQRRGVRPGVGGEAVSHRPLILRLRRRCRPTTTSTRTPSAWSSRGQWFLQKGKMIAYYGQIDFNGIGHGRARPAGAHAASTRRCTPATGWSPRAAARCCSPTGPSTSTRTTWRTAT